MTTGTATAPTVSTAANTAAEFRAVIECTADPCTYCRDAATRYPQTAHVFDTEDAAAAHGRGMARKVYGASTHRVVVEQRAVTAWNAI